MFFYAYIRKIIPIWPRVYHLYFRIALYQYKFVEIVLSRFFHTNRIIDYIYIYIYIYIYVCCFFIKLYRYFCLNIFVFILSSCRIGFLISGGNWVIKLICFPHTVVYPRSWWYQSNSTYKYTGGLKYTGDSVVQVRTVLLISDFNSSTRGERQFLKVFRIILC